MEGLGTWVTSNVTWRCSFLLSTCKSCSIQLWGGLAMPLQDCDGAEKPVSLSRYWAQTPSIL